MWILPFRPTNDRVKIKESEKMNKYFDFVREIRNLWNMWMIVMPIVIGALGTVPKGFERRLE